MVDEMLGRLARYLRFMGFDTVYARGVSDEEIRTRSEREERILVTRDRSLAARTPGAVPLRATDIDGQLSELRRAFPAIRWEIRAERCTLCNGRLARWTPGPEESIPEGTPREHLERGVALYRCSSCDQMYWEGSHAVRVRERIALARRQSET